MNLDPTLIRLLIPVLILQFALQAISLVDLVKREQVTGGNKWVWAAVILIFAMFGPLAYFTLGRKEA